MWDGTSDAIAWADAGNWGGVDYPRTNNDKATIPTSLAHSITTAGAHTIGELDMQTGCTADITLGGNMIIDDAGSENGDCTITAGTYDTSGTDFAFTADGDVSVTGTFTGNASAVSNGSLTIPSGGTYDATSGTTTITSETSGNNSIYVNGGTLTHNSGTFAFTLSGSSVMRGINSSSTTITFYNLTISQGTGTGQIFRYCHVTVAGNLSITNGVINLGSANGFGTFTVTGTSTIGDGSGAASSAKLTCNSSTVDLNDTITIDTDGELSAPDSSGTFTFSASAAGSLTIKGVYTANGGTLDWDSANANGLKLYTDATFCNLEISGAGQFAPRAFDAARTLTITDSLDISNASGRFTIRSTTYITTLALGTSSNAATVDTTGVTATKGITFYSTSNVDTVIKAANQNFPTICTGTDWDWDSGGAITLTIQDLDYRIAATTGGGGVTVTATRCKFPLGATISSGDIVKIAANTASGFKKVEGGGTLQVVRGGGVVILDGIDDPVNLQNVALPTALNPAQICCNYIQGVSS